MTRKVLGRGLEALISSDTAAVATEGRMPQAGTTELAVELITPNQIGRASCRERV